VLFATSVNLLKNLGVGALSSISCASSEIRYFYLFSNEVSAVEVIF
jgi:hypothetical protein